MPPQQPGNQPNLDFIMNSGAPSAKKSLLPAGNSTGQRIAIVAVIAGVLLAFLLVLMLILGGGGDNKQNLLKIAQQQTELVRVSAFANQGDNQTLKNFGVNTSATIESDKQKLAAALGANGIAFKEKEIALGTDPKTDELLATAKAAANFDPVLASILAEQLTDYQALLKTAFEQSNNADIKSSLRQAYANAGLLLKQGQPEAAPTP